MVEKRRTETLIVKSRTHFNKLVINRIVKQESTSYKSTIPNFDTIDDSVKAYGGLNYDLVYKKKKDVDSELLERYQRREFIPGRKAFWKVPNMHSL